ncbi:MAG: DUF2784 domain-containing protein [Gammaproteobacteria bacterium]|nr:DUF2784 domain-containing protein [Gammaproteobacteria bacterium]
MWARFAADVVLILHMAFILFVVGGALLVLRYPWLAWLHVPAALWGTWVELTNRICPLTVLENLLRGRAGQSGYSESFVEHYLVPVIYPSGLTRSAQFWLAGILVTVNVAVYTLWLLRRRKTRINLP